MVITLNKNPLDLTFEQEKTVGEVLGLLELECKKNKNTIIEVAVDKVPLTADELDELFIQSIDSDIRIDLTSISGDEVRDFITMLGGEFEKNAEAIELIPIHLHEQKMPEIFAILENFSKNLQDLYRSLTLADIAMLPTELKVADTPIVEFQESLNELLETLLTALEKNDTVLASDIAEYELSPLVKELANTLLFSN